MLPVPKASVISADFAELEHAACFIMARRRLPHRDPPGRVDHRSFISYGLEKAYRHIRELGTGVPEASQHRNARKFETGGAPCRCLARIPCSGTTAISCSPICGGPPGPLIITDNPPSSVPGCEQYLGSNSVILLSDAPALREIRRLPWRSYPVIFGISRGVYSVSSSRFYTLSWRFRAAVFDAKAHTPAPLISPRLADSMERARGLR